MDKKLRFPDFYCVGVQKAGTSWLHHNLSSHPDVWMPRMKEIQYFNHLYLPWHRAWTDRHRLERIVPMVRNHVCGEGPIDFRYLEYLAICGQNRLDDEWYANFFSLAADDQICGEVTPEYSMLPDEGIQHLLNLNTDCRIILLLRHPLERALSHVKMLVSREDANRDMSREALLSATERFLGFADVWKRCRYEEIVPRWEKHVDSSRLFIGFFDDIRNQPASLMRDICQFLGVPFSETNFPDLEKKVFEGKAFQIPEHLIAPHLDQVRQTLRYCRKRFPDQTSTWK